MDPLTHTLTGVALSYVGLNRKTRFATVTAVVGANFPDVDIVTALGGSATYLKYHRGLSHSVLGITVLAALLAGLVHYLGRKAPLKKTGPPLNGLWLLLVSWLATASHLLLDYTNSYGVRPFLPFSGRWYAGDIMFIVDPLIWALLAAGLGLPVILRLVSEEVGAPKSDLRRGAIFSLCSIALLCGIREVLHRRALNVLDSHLYAQENPLRLGAFPIPVNPFTWTGVIETESAFHVLPVRTLENDIDPQASRLFRKAEPSPPLEAALKTRTATIFLNFARFSWAHVDDTEEGYDVTLRDLRFISPTLRRRGFVVEIELDKDLRVRSESFSFSSEARRSAF